MRAYKSEGSFPVKLLRNVVLILLLIIFASVFLHFRNKESGTVSALSAEATASNEYKGIFVRNEEPVRFSGSGTLSYKVSDGGRLGKGSIIAEVYPNEEQVSINREINKLTKKLELLEKIQNPGTLESAQPASLSEGIEEDYRSLIYCRDMKEYGSMQSYMDDILVQMSTYQIITDEVTDFAQQTEDIKNQLAVLQQNSVHPSETVKSERSAYFVSYCDGYEDRLNEKNLGSLTIDELKNITDNRLSESNIVGKLVDGYKWYLVVIADNSHKEYAVGDSVSLRFESSAEIYDAEITDIRDEGQASESIMTMLCSRFDYDLVQHRIENVEIIKGEYSGLKVPREAIRFLDLSEKLYDDDGKEYEVTVNTKGVYIMKGEQVTFKKIDVIYEGSDYVLSAEHSSDTEYLALYDDIIIEGAD